MAQSLADILASIAPGYDQERAPVNANLAALPAARAAEDAGLETARTNAFTDVTNAANRRGVLYSGAPIDEQNRYVGEKYLPARAAVAENYTNKTSALQQQLANIAQRQNQQAQGILTQQQQADAEAAYRAAQLAEQRRANEAAQAAANARAAASRSSSGGSSRSAGSAGAGYTKGSDSVGGLAYRDSHGNPITSAQYYEAKGATGIGAIIADLRNSKNKGDAAIANDAASGKYTYDQLAQKYPYVFGGV